MYTPQHFLCSRHTAMIEKTRHQRETSSQVIFTNQEEPRTDHEWVRCCEPAGLQAGRPAWCRAAESHQGEDPGSWLKTCLLCRPSTYTRTHARTYTRTHARMHTRTHAHTQFCHWWVPVTILSCINFT